MSRSPLLLLITALTLPVIAGAQSALPAFPASECATRASRATQPFAEVFVGATCVDLTQYITPDAGGWTLATPLLSVGTSQFAAQAAFDFVDISFFTQTLNETATPVTYAFVFGEPTPLAGFTGLSAYGDMQVTSHGAVAMVAPGGVYPTYLSAYIDLDQRRTHVNVDLGAAPCVAPAALDAITVTCPMGTRTSTFAPIAGNALEALFTYTQTGAGSVVGFTNDPAVSPPITVAPEPTSLALSAFGFVAVGLIARRRSPA